jgi:hypothetical protein
MRRLLFAVVALVGCDPATLRHTPDAEKAIDAPADAPTHGMVTFKVLDPSGTGAVVAGVPVVFIEADGTLVGHPVTDTNGVATADVHKDASATVVIASPSNTQLYTVTGLKPFDNILFGPNTPPSTTDGTFTVNFNAYPGATSYDVYGPCGENSTSTTSVVLTMTSDCKQSPMDIQVIANNAQGRVGYQNKLGIAYTAGGSTTLNGTYDFIQTFTANYSDVAPSITNINFTRSAPDFNGFGDGAGGTPMTGSLSVQSTATLSSKATVQTRVSKGRQIDVVIQQIAGNALTYGMDVGTTILPFISPPTFDLATRTLHVPVDTTGTTTDAPDVFYVEARYSRMIDANTTTSFDWYVFGAQPADVTLPMLPPEVGDVMPKTTDSTGGSFALMLEADNVNGWDAVRPDIYGLFDTVIGGVHPTAMRIRESTNNGT